MQRRASSLLFDQIHDSRLRELAPKRPDHAHSATLPRDVANAKKSNVKAACEPCRRRRIKCNGARPQCDSCTKLRVDCIYTTNTDSETRGQALKRRCSQLDDRLQIYDRIFGFLQSRPSQESEAIYKRIRAGADVEAIIRYAEEGDLFMDLNLVPETRYRSEFPYINEMPLVLQHADNVYLKSTIYEWTLNPTPQLEPPIPSAYSTPFHAAELVDPPIASAKISRWTSVIADEQLLKKLLQTYFLYHYPRYISFHKDYFFQDMKAGRGQFCSSLLVNSVLAAACRTECSMADRSKSLYPRDLGSLFLAEAQRLWEQEASTAALTTIQAAIVLQVVCSIHGIDKNGSMYMGRAISMANDLQLFLACEQMERPRRDPWLLTAWALFNFETVQSYYFLRDPLLAKLSVPLPDPLLDYGSYGEIYVRYPLDKTFYSTSFGEAFKAHCELRLIMHDMTVELLKEPNGAKKLSWTRTSYYRNQLNTWYARLPSTLSPQLIVLPLHLMLHIEYHGIIITLFSAQVSVASDTDDQNTISAQTKAARDIVTDGVIKLEILVRLYYLRHGSRWYDPFIIHALIILANFVLDCMKAASTVQAREGLRSTLILCLKGVYEQGRMFAQGAVVFRLIRGTLEEDDRIELDRYLGLEASDEEEVQAMAQSMQSQWVVPISKRVDDVDSSRLVNMIKDYSLMSIEDSVPF